MNVQYQQYDCNLITDAPSVQTALAPTLFRRACPSGYVSHLSGCCLADHLTDCGSGVTVCTTQCPASTISSANAAPSSSGCAVNYVSFAGSCCLSTSLLDCGGTYFCTGQCPATATTPSVSSSQSSSVSSPTTSSQPLSTSASSPSSPASGQTGTTTVSVEVLRTLAPQPIPTTRKSGLSTSAKAGMGIRAALVLVGLGIGIFFLLSRRRRQQEHKTQAVPPAYTPGLPGDMQQPRTDRFGNLITWGNRRRHELGDTVEVFRGAELDAK